MTYSNAISERKALIDFSMKYVLTAIEQRLSMADFVSSTTEVRFSLDEFLRGDPLQRAQVYEILNRIGAMTVEQIREEEDFKNLHKFISENAETWNAPNADQYIDLVLEYSIVEFVYEYKDDEIDTIGEEKTIDLWKGLIPVIKKVYEKHLKLYYALHKEEY